MRCKLTRSLSTAAAPTAHRTLLPTDTNVHGLYVQEHVHEAPLAHTFHRCDASNTALIRITVLIVTVLLHCTVVVVYYNYKYDSKTVQVFLYSACGARNAKDAHARQLLSWERARLQRDKQLRPNRTAYLTGERRRTARLSQKEGKNKSAYIITASYDASSATVLLYSLLSSVG